MEWIPIDHSLPPADALVLVTDGREIFLDQRLDGEALDWLYGSPVTHWMALPALP